MKKLLIFSILFLLSCSNNSILNPILEDTPACEWWEFWCEEVAENEPHSLCDGDGVELWGEWYDIESTTWIGLSESSIIGEIPPEIGCLTNLYHLGLSYNQLTGEIPPEIGNLTNLVRLYLSNNQLTGEIPPEIGNLTNLEGLWLYNNQLTGEIPQEVCDLIESNNLNMSNILYGNNLINTCE